MPRGSILSVILFMIKINKITICLPPEIHIKWQASKISRPVHICQYQYLIYTIDVNIHTGKALNAIDRLSIMWKLISQM